METILVDALENQILHGSARSTLTRVNRFTCWRDTNAELIAEPVTLSSIYGRALFLSPLVPKGCFLTGNSAAWVWAGQTIPPETLYIASARRPLRAADSRFWIHLDISARRMLTEQGIKALGSKRESNHLAISSNEKTEGVNQTDFLSIGKVKLLSPWATLHFCKDHPNLPGSESWNPNHLLTLANRLFS
ncbi:hypothetical protein [Varibaculum vaginae]|uniref:hypothetical protein n=1 Tax=Varibaculum vaginae TaxID=2364797 RepID=UPI000F0848BF|nr:hypothetical protein [Varibaculum vaginae]